MLNIVTIHAIRKTPSLTKNLKTLLLSLAVSDLGVGLVAQPLYVARLIMESQLNIETSKTYIEDITRWREDMNFMFEWQ